MCTFVFLHWIKSNLVLNVFLTCLLKSGGHEKNSYWLLPTTSYAVLDWLADRRTYKRVLVQVQDNTIKTIPSYKTRSHISINYSSNQLNISPTHQYIFSNIYCKYMYRHCIINLTSKNSTQISATIGGGYQLISATQFHFR